MKRITNAFLHVRQHGVGNTVRYALERVSEAYHERRLGIQTSAHRVAVPLSSDPFAAPYYPSDYRSIIKAFRALTIPPGQDAFLDYGCGLGRVLAVAAIHPFRRVVGIERDPTLADLARANIERSRRKKCTAVEVVCRDAVDYPVDANVGCIFFYNPFHGPVLTKVLDNIRASLERTPRTVQIVFKNTTYLHPLMGQYPWLALRHEFRAYDANHRVAIFEGRVK